MRLIAFLLLCSTAFAVDYPVVVVKSVRPDDTTRVEYPEVFHAVAHPPSDLVILKPDGTTELLLSGNGVDALFDPKPSYPDAKWVYYVKVPECESVNTQRGSPDGAPYSGVDIWRINVETKQVVRVTDQKWELPDSAGGWSDTPSVKSGTELSVGYGVINIGPCPFPGGKVAFTSNRRGYQPPNAFAFPNSQLFILDDIPGETDTDGEVGRNVECTGFLNVSAALHPTLAKDGKILWASHENQGRDLRLWSIWSSYPDGREWGPVYSAMSGTSAFHFHGQRGDGSLFSAYYYNLNNNGAGSILESSAVVEMPEYLSPDQRLNPGIDRAPSGSTSFTKFQLSTQRRGTYSVTPWTAHDDSAVTDGKVTHPSAAPDNGMLVCYTPGPANNLLRPTNIPTYHFKIGLISGKVSETLADMEILLESAGHNYTQPVALVPWTEIYGSLAPEIPVDPNPSGTPFGIVGSSSAHIGQWKPIDKDSTQGFWSGAPGDETADGIPPVGIDIVATSPVVLKAYGPNFGKHNDSGWSNALNERTRVLSRIRFNEEGRPAGDTSWWAKIPANVPFTFRTFDDSGRTITWARTWHQVKPGESRVNCGGCHNHSGQAIPFYGDAGTSSSPTFASTQQPKEFDQSVVRTPEFNRDVLPIFQSKCLNCHDGTHPVKLDATIAKSDYVVPGKAWVSRLSKAIHGEGDTAQMPMDAPALSAEEKLKIDEWIDYWCLVAEPGKADFDESPPTLYVSRHAGELKVGAYDYQSGLASVTVNGDPVTLTDHVYTGAELALGDTVVVEATDNAGSTTRIERTIREEAPLDDEIEQLKQQILQLQTEIDTLKEKLERIAEIVNN